MYKKYITVTDTLFDTVYWLKINGDVIESNECLYICCIFNQSDKSSFVGDLNSTCRYSVFNYDYIECDSVHEQISDLYHLLVSVITWRTID